MRNKKGRLKEATAKCVGERRGEHKFTVVGKGTQGQVNRFGHSENSKENKRNDKTKQTNVKGTQ